MSIQVVHIIHSLSKINFGIWNAALFSSAWLKENANVETRVWVCERNDETLVDKVVLPLTFLKGKSDADSLQALAIEQRINTDTGVFVTHGCWLQPTSIGYRLKKRGYRWLYVPHGMLESWSLEQGKIKKALYYRLFEGRMNRKATSVRAVSAIEKMNLERKLNREVHLVENGVTVPPLHKKVQQEMVFLFMARLHHKKGIVPLVTAWKTVMADDPHKRLVIAGPDEGELKQIQPFLGNNVSYVGAVYGIEKIGLLQQAHYFVLPSFSEGFPTSVLEAMSHGIIPLISEGCNFREVFAHRLGYKAEPDIQNLQALLGMLKDKPFDNSLSERNHEFIQNHYSEERIGRKLFNLYSGITQIKNSHTI